ncbi:hypothetical protein [Streptomyces sp. B6B3]|uniref:hypothetical protein n=1 Tax=Streptomyces sp. B6B3 TaxID=3153570 RepID=UPI00325CF363
MQKKAEELVRAAAALYLDGTTYQGGPLKGGDAIVAGRDVRLARRPRHECVYIMQVTAS